MLLQWPIVCNFRNTSVVVGEKLLWNFVRTSSRYKIIRLCSVSKPVYNSTARSEGEMPVIYKICIGVALFCGIKWVLNKLFPDHPKDHSPARTHRPRPVYEDQLWPREVIRTNRPSGSHLNSYWQTSFEHHAEDHSPARTHRPRPVYEDQLWPREVIRTNRPSGSHLNSNWQTSFEHHPKKERLVKTQVEGLVEASSTEEFTVKKLILKTLPNVQITKIMKVNNTFLEALYELKKEEYISRYRGRVIEKVLLHVTGVTNVKYIIKDNFDWRRVSRGKFGLGTSFSDDAKYANHYANINIGNNRVFIITKVLVSKEIRGQQNLLIPMYNYDTTTGNGKKVYVKFCDNETLPIFVAYYSNETLPKR
ncbi:uncharacterized protein LOC124362471 isoform X1 [Homalodisca vitripennis]|uniref:uncharacterized protein LOC124362471 isoform X1 n=1 Tax=Homalodisca vitripennis TaxID=197043 RepID=UPI001EECCBAE|nr:uncharacterized protein LOC124362471 isoform X1 [Homalodisca vitripennis]